MREFFKGWRRKMGCVALTMACVVALVWLRSTSVCDEVNHVFFGKPSMLLSVDGEIYWYSWDYLPPRFEWTSRTENRRSPYMLDILFLAKDNVANGRGWRFTYWYFAIPLTLLSACLLLWKPRNQKPSPTSQPPTT